MKRLAFEQEEELCAMILEGKALDEASKAVGFKNRRAFQKYQVEFPDFQVRLEAARVAQCQYLEEMLLNVADDYNKDYAKVKLEAIAKILKYRDPKKYGDKMDLTSTVTIDIAGSIERAAKRVQEMLPVNVVPLIRGKGGLGED